MGMLVNTLGTRVVKALLNIEFGTNFIGLYRDNFMGLFNPGSANRLITIVNAIVYQHPGDSGRPDHRPLLPRDGNLTLRWQKFLNGFLLPANDVAIRDNIYQGLGYPDYYTYIYFDCIDAGAAEQSVIVSDEFDSTQGVWYKSITLVTAAMPPPPWTPTSKDQKYLKEI